MADAQGAFVTRAFERILKDSNARRFQKLHHALRAYLDRSKEVPVSVVSAPVEPPEADSSEARQDADGPKVAGAAAAMAEAGHGFDPSESNIILTPLRLALETKQSKLQETALDCIHKLIGYGHLQGDCGLEGGRNSASNTQLFQLVCICADNTAVDSVVLQVIKVLLTAVASPSFHVHGESLVLALRTLYNIVLNSKSHINISTARGTLTQMISVVFKRMEVVQHQQQRQQLQQSQPPDAVGGSTAQPQALAEGNAAQAAGTTPDGQGEGTGGEEAKRPEGQGAEAEDAAVLAAAAGGTPDLQVLEAALDRALQVTPSEGAEAGPGDAPAAGRGGAPGAGADARTESERGVALESLATMGQRDALLLFRTLCKMAMKDGTEELVTRTKVLSLQLLQGLLEGVSEEFTVNYEFLDTVKMHLCYALVRACVSADDRVFQCSSDIFGVLVRRYRRSLKAEIGLFFPLLVLRPLDSADMTLPHRATTLGMLEDITADAQVLADIFVNYDCDLDSKNLFERMVKSIARTAGHGTSPGGSDKGGSHSAAEGGGPQSATATAVKTAAVQALVNVMRSIETWYTKDKPHLGRPLGRGLSKSSEAGTSDAASEAEGGSGEGEGEGIGDPPGGNALVAAVEALEHAEQDASSQLLLSQAGQFEKMKTQKQLVEEAVFQFNMKPEKGIKFLLRSNVVPKEPEKVAHFLRTTQGLDKSAIGDYLGQHDDFQLAVMHKYCESIPFAGLKFDQAIRVFLQGFRLPGEAQKIDRIMEKFAERYCCDNPEVFKTADAAYVLAYAVIMLNTDAHNPQVTAKMSKSDFVRMNAATNTEGGGAVEEAVPVPLLEEIYDSIVGNEIKLRDDAPKGGAGGKGAKGASGEGVLSVLNIQAAKRKTTAELKAESDDIVRRTQALVKRSTLAGTVEAHKGTAAGAAAAQAAAAVPPQQRVFHSASDADLGRPMLETVGWPLVATVSMSMEDGDAKHARVALCMEGLRLGIHLSLLMGLDTLRYAFLTSLVRYTFLHAPREMRVKNVEATRTLLLLAEQDPDALQDTWNAVLECVSRLEHIVSSPSLAASLMAMNNQVSRDALLASLQDLSTRPLEQVFVISSRLPSDAIVEFFTALCAVSMDELRQFPPRVFSLQKLVEISYYNMTRIRMIWARIWALLSVHFIAAGQHPDQQVAMYAMDSIRQLALKYLERAELTNFSFQNDILKPFVVVMRTSKNELIREFILQCVVQMIKLKVTGIKSGWRSVFMVLTTAAADPFEPVVDLAFENAEHVVLENFDQIVGDCFMDCVNCLMAFSNNPTSPRISLKAIALLRICEDRLAEGRVPGGVVRPVNEGQRVADSDVAEFYWFPMLAGLSELTSDPRPEVRSCAVEVLFDLLTERGHKFSTRFWESVFERILFPIFDYVRHAGSGGEKPGPADLWLRDTSIHCLHLLCDLFCHFYEEVAFVLPSLLGLLLDCATRPDQKLASISVEALARLMDGGAQHFSKKDWGMLLDSVREAVLATRPTELLGEEAAQALAEGALEGTQPLSQRGSRESTSSSNKERSPQLPSKIPTGEAATALLSQQLSSSIAIQAEAAAEAGAILASAGMAAGAPNEPEGSASGDTAAGAESTGTAAAGEGEGNGEEEGGASAEVAAQEQETESTPEATGGATSEQEQAADADTDAKKRESLDSNTFGRRFMDALLLRNMGIGRARSSSVASQPEVTAAAAAAEATAAAAAVAAEAAAAKTAKEEEAAAEGEEAVEVVSHAVRVKCYTQLLLLGALDRLQSGHWSQLDGPLRTQLAECVACSLDFAVLYNSDLHVRDRMRSSGPERPPLCLLRQEALGTQLLLTVLLKALRDPAVERLASITTEHVQFPGAAGAAPGAPVLSKLSQAGTNGMGGRPKAVEAFSSPTLKPGAAAQAEEEEAEAERLLLKVCERVLQVSATLQPGGGQAVEADVHRSLALRAPIVATVLLALSAMDGDRFERFASNLYSHCTKLICSDQMDVRKALADLFRERLASMVPVA